MRRSIIESSVVRSSNGPFLQLFTSVHLSASL
jgi:hypothetical protein